MLKIADKNVKPFLRLMRLDKPIGIFLLLWPTLWALWIAANGIPNFKILIIFILGVVIMRSAGCVINDIADRGFDGQVNRTKSRPLVMEEVSVKSAFILFVVLCAMGFLLVLQLNLYTMLLSTVALILAIVYPFTKRFTYFPQVILGAAFAWSIPMAFAAQTNQVPNVAWILYGIAVIWPVAYDSMYALTDKQDDIRLGIKSTAILFGRFVNLSIFCLQISVIAGLIILGRIIHLHSLFYFCLLGAFILIGYQLYLVVVIKNFQRAFENNHWVGFVIFLGIVGAYLY